MAVAACTGANPRFGAFTSDASADAGAPDGSADGLAHEPIEVDRDASADAPTAAPADMAKMADMAAASQVNGLRGDYFVGRAFEQLAFSRIDPLVDFRWVHAAPDPRLPEDDFSIRWTGEISPRHSELYTFQVDHDDGVRLWIGGVALIDLWDRTGDDTRAEIALSADQRYPIQIEYFDRALTATIRLSWSSASQSEEIVPHSRTHTPPLP